MYLLLSGEGPTDMGAAKDDVLLCEGEAFLQGPMAVIVDQAVEARLNYSVFEVGSFGFVSEHRLARRAAELKAVKKALRLPGKKQAKETRYCFNGAWILARIATEVEAEREEEVVAVLFRDSDGTASAGRGLWEDKRQSMLDGFGEEGYTRGVPMIPKPKPEAWVLCGLKRNPYQGCEALEQRSGNDDSPKALKKELAKILGQVDIREALCEMLVRREIDIERIDMPSFAAFRSRLEESL
ncbi:MAG TPA: hypothetical protein VKA46_16615 [Gemmataceae bacterium]|nr:hypothetical protein [Gemmataceae bacterium]